MFGKKLKELRNLEGWTQQYVADRLGISKQRYNNWELGKRKPGLAMIRKLADIYQIDFDTIIQDESQVGEETAVYKVDSEIPIIGTIAAGTPLLAEQNVVGYAPAPPMMNLKGKNVFYLEIKGESMNREFANGSYVLIDRDLQVENGEIAAVMVNGDEATVKKVYKKDNLLTLMPMSTDSSYFPQVIDLEKEEVTVIGKVIGAFKQY